MGIMGRRKASTGNPELLPSSRNERTVRHVIGVSVGYVRPHGLIASFGSMIFNGGAAQEDPIIKSGRPKTIRAREPIFSINPPAFPHSYLLRQPDDPRPLEPRYAVSEEPLVDECLP